MSHGASADVPGGDMRANYRESRIRSFLKALSWRITGLVVTSSVVLVITGSLEFAAAAAAIDSLLKIVLYYVHERAWNQAGFGRATSSGLGVQSKR
jgi:uncharacterized membrane protein